MQGTPVSGRTKPPSARRAAGRLGLVLASATGLFWHSDVGRAAGPESMGGGASAALPAAMSLAVIPDRRDWQADPLQMFRRYSAVGLIDPKTTFESMHADGGKGLRPIFARGLEPFTRRRLSTAFPVALRHLNEAPACRALYEGLGTDGLLALSTTVYVSTASSDSAGVCSALNAVALTRVGQGTTILCPTFADLSTVRAAVTLLHEALHYAGLPERPADPAALSSLEITRLVRNRCGL